MIGYTDNRHLASLIPEYPIAWDAAEQVQAKISIDELTVGKWTLTGEAILTVLFDDAEVEENRFYVLAIEQQELFVMDLVNGNDLPLEMLSDRPSYEMIIDAINDGMLNWERRIQVI